MHVKKGLQHVPEATLKKARKLALMVGTLAGAFGSLVGVGGGVLISPVIANACKALPQRVISGTSLAAVAATGSAAGYVYWNSGAVDLTSAALIAVAAVTTAPLGARATHAFDCAMLRRLMAYWLFAVAPLVPLKAYLVKAYGGTAPAPPPPSSTEPAAAAAAASAPAAVAVADDAVAAADVAAASAPAGSLWRPVQLWGGDGVLLLTGTVAGFASGLLGIGGGTIVTPLLTLATGLPQVSVLGTSLAAMVLPSLLGLAQHARLGNVDWRMAAGLAAGTAVGSTAGGRLGLVLPEGVLEWLFCAGMLYLGRKTLAGANATRAAAAAAAAAGAGGVGTAAAPGVVGAAVKVGAVIKR
ncbi:hypothetical protein TSOC_008329 [Tetrabaena socialis]|uniref:Uncharacterized protein n=1 Tax=Tetrabaena socialis TaxID=47790 RepID=A0A2J7ZYS8_9CHLO|nr:hypothetical protein TSOC_008329 [Tetrabaena socialis]|eukprot:PNH05425.1 hypothetical protein TSOC_008329 [Tetrabaena socialis]